MRRAVSTIGTALVIALSLFLITTPAKAATLIKGSQIERTWNALGGLGLEVRATVSGSALSADNLPGCAIVYTDSHGKLLCGSSGSGGSLTLSRIGASTYSTVQHLMNFSLSPGVSSGGTLSQSGTTAYLRVGAGNGFIKASDSDVATLSFFDWQGSGASLIPLGTIRYIGVSYNSGSPKVVQRTSDSWDYDTEFPLGLVVNDGGELHIMQNKWITGDAMTDVIERFDGEAPCLRDERQGGLTLGVTGTRNVTTDAGQMLCRLSEFPIPALDTSASSTFVTYYRDGVGGWTKTSGVTQFPNTAYDDGDGTLGSVSNTQRASLWFYLEPDGDLVMLYGQARGTFADILQNDEPPSIVPERLNKTGILIGRIIFRGTVNAPEAIQSAFTTVFNPTQAGDTYTAGQGLTLASNSFKVNSTLTGSLVRFATVSGSTLFARNELSSSGTLSVDGISYLQNNVSVNGTVSFVGYSGSPQLTAADATTGMHFDGPAIISFHNGGNQTMLLSSTNRVGIGSNAPKSKLDVVGTVSGSALTVSGLRNCAFVQTDANGVTSCGLASTFTYAAGEGLTVSSNVFSRNPALSGTSLTVFGTMSGRLLTQNGGGTNYLLGNVSIGKTGNKAKLDVLGTLSGTALTISGPTPGLVTKLANGTTTFRTITAGSCISISNGNGVSGNPTITGTCVTTPGGDDNDVQWNRGPGAFDGSSDFEFYQYGSNVTINRQSGGGYSGNASLTVNVNNADEPTGIFYGVGDPYTVPALQVRRTDNDSAYWNVYGNGKMTTNQITVTDPDSASVPTVFFPMAGVSTDAGFSREIEEILDYGVNYSQLGSPLGVDSTKRGVFFRIDTRDAYTDQSFNITVIEAGGGESQVFRVGNDGTMTIPSAGANIAGNLTIDTNTLFVNASANNVGVGNVAPKANLAVTGTVSGALLTLSQGATAANYITGNLGIGKATSKAKLDVAGTVSGTTLTAQSFTGGTLALNKSGAGSGKLSIHGSAGSYACLNSPNGNWWMLSVTNAGAVQVNAATPPTCP